jgi:Trypsin-like peptidase domain
MRVTTTSPGRAGRASTGLVFQGRDLAFSFQDNELLDHEGPPAGRPQIPGVCRVHYRAPTEGGSSGSPVFNARLWEVIALHHKGGKIGMPKLNGQEGSYAANEGISMLSVKEGVRDHGA